MKRHLLKYVVLTFAMSTVVQSQAITLEQAAQNVLANSHDLKVLRLQAESSNWGEKKAYASYLPKLDLRGRYLAKERFEELEIPFGGTTFVMPAIEPYTDLGFTATFNLFNGFKDFNDIRAANLEKEAFQYRLTRAEGQKRAQIRTLFYRALGSQILVDVANQNIQTLQNHLSDVSSRVRIGVSTRYDTLRVDVQLEDAKTEKIAAEGAVVISRAKLFEAMGQADDGTPIEGQMPENLSRIDINKASIENLNRADRAVLISERDQSQFASRSAKAHWLPKISLFGNYEWYNNINHSIVDTDERFKSAYALGVQMSWNLFDGGAGLASQRQALIANQIAQEKLAQLDENIPVAIEEAKRRFSYDVINYNAKLSSIRKAEEAVRLAKGGVKAGTRTNTEVLDAVVDLNRAKAAAIKSQIDAIEALGELELSVGHML